MDVIHLYMVTTRNDPSDNLNNMRSTAVVDSKQPNCRITHTVY